MILLASSLLFSEVSKHLSSVERQNVLMVRSQNLVGTSVDMTFLKEASNGPTRQTRLDDLYAYMHVVSWRMDCSSWSSLSESLKEMETVRYLLLALPDDDVQGLSAKELRHWSIHPANEVWISVLTKNGCPVEMEQNSECSWTGREEYFIGFTRGTPQQEWKDVHLWDGFKRNRWVH